MLSYHYFVGHIKEKSSIFLGHNYTGVLDCVVGFAVTSIDGQILTSKVDPRTERIKIFIMAVDP